MRVRPRKRWSRWTRLQSLSAYLDPETIITVGSSLSVPISKTFFARSDRMRLQLSWTTSGAPIMRPIGNASVSCATHYFVYAAITYEYCLHPIVFAATDAGEANDPRSIWSPDRCSRNSFQPFWVLYWSDDGMLLTESAKTNDTLKSWTGKTQI